jgi:diguanylate cyclase (GGDEF)-like protein/PAS domain S-box-containing protein
MNMDELNLLDPACTLPAAPAPMRILLVDDEPRMLSSLEALLQDRGHALTSASCGLEALALLRQSTFDLAILDLNLPDIDGHEIMDFMNAQATGANIIVTSGASGIDAAIGALKRGAYDYLRKPYAREELLKTVDNALLQRRLQAENQRIAARLEHSERVHRNLVDSSPDIIYTLDVQGHFTFVNDRAQQVLGFDREALIGQHYTAFFHEEDLERAHYVFSEVQQQRHLLRNVELRFKTGRPGGEPRTFSHALLATDPQEHGLATDSLAPRQFGVYGVARDITERKQAEELITYQTYHDILTQLPNRVLFKDRLGLALLQAKRHDTSLAVMFIDLDRFKLINDTLGHGTGDLLLQQVTARLQTCLRRCDTLSRLGGDEFTVVLPELQNRHDASVIASKFSDCLRQPFELAGQAVHVSASIGIAVYPQDGQTVDELIRNADSAMYHRKTQGKNGHAFFDHAMLDAAAHKIAIEHSLHLALERGELEMYYQPQVDVKTRKLIGAEALIRWNHPERGFLGAGEFLPFAEENGLMIPITDWMLETICLDLLAWNAVSSEPMRLSINLSPQYLDRGDFFDKLRDALQRHRVPPAQIEVEVTENISIRNPQAAIDQLDKLCQLGVSVAIDDFGTGYSSLSYLHRFPIHTLKIDRAFITEIRDAQGQFPVVRAIISIAQGLGFNLVAEGVETLAQERYLEQVGCRIMQGYLYHKPMQQQRLLELLREQSQPLMPAR